MTHPATPSTVEVKVMSQSILGHFPRLASNNRYYALADQRLTGKAPERDYARARQVFLANLPAMGVVLGVGAGDGRDLKHLQEAGRSVLGVEPCAERRRRSEAAGVAAIDGTFENLGSLPLPALAGAWCGAALRHVPSNNLARALRNLAAVLPLGAPLFLALELGDGSTWQTLDPPVDGAESFVQRFSEDEVEQALGRRFSAISRWTASGPEHTGRWTELVVRTT
jgi:hypothetical protein